MERVLEDPIIALICVGDLVGEVAAAAAAAAAAVMAAEAAATTSVILAPT